MDTQTIIVLAIMGIFVVGAVVLLAFVNKPEKDEGQPKRKE